MGDLEVPNWLKKLPSAPEFRPTDTEFADPIAYISKIEKEASAFGICKVIPPLPKPSKKFVFANLNNSLAKAPELVSDVNSKAVCLNAETDSGNRRNDDEFRAVFTTRYQELGHTLKRTKGLGSVSRQSSIHKQVWQSGEVYTLDQFESKAKAFARSQLAMIKDVSALVIEALFWKVASEKPIYVEYANDVPGSGFGEPEEPFQYSHKRRRKRKFDKKCQSSTNCENNKLDTASNLPTEDVFVKNDSELSLETCKQSSSSSNAGSNMEGTAGWKLSNSPWNLQVISRSPGSLTRFMLDDIPGVTSPMVYIGMLFSWFAWHVEDHELHSLNFLHTGSPKTWYAVPGDYAFYFEEVIRSKGYEGDIDRLAALALLGEKTNLLSPELVVTSGIPCCRLVQNPGEYVVTFPRAYHIGFSHGFNCGEAANFGTSQWLKVAKDAAIRRAAMSYLPMLSHQQLLYMLTMSFVSRVPRVLLPGARSSRLRDRQKEERELMVKKTFIDDMLNENKLLMALLAKDSTFYATLWDPESVSSQSNDHQLFPSPANVDAPCSLVDEDNVQISNSEKKISSVENVHNDISNASTVSIGGSSLIESKYGGGCNSHTDRTRIYKRKLEDFYMEYDDLPCGLHVDSGTLACVACGILGFPFMAIVQPSLKASEELFPADNQMFQQGLESLKPPVPSYPDDAAMNSCSDPHNPVPNLSQVSKDLPRHPSAKIDKIYHKWNGSNGFLRPRIFCLEHALEIEELLHSKGGANVLVICHSAYLKIKAHALAVAEEICVPFNYRKVPLENASQEDLNLINISIDDEENEECNEDWTSRMGINLQHHAKLRKLSPLKQEQHVLALGKLFSGIISESDVSTLRWISKRPRTSLRAMPSQSKVSEPTHLVKDDLLIETAERRKFNGANKIKQYSRRSSNNRERVSHSQANSKTHDHSKKQQQSEVSALKQISDSAISKDTSSGVENANGFAVPVSSLAANHEVRHESQTSEKIAEINKVSDPPNCATSPIEKIENDPEVDNFHRVGNSDVVQCEVSTIGEARDTSEVSDQANSRSPPAIVSIKNYSVGLTDLHNVEKHKMQNEICMTEETRGVIEASDQANLEASPSIIKLVVESAHAKTEGQTVEVDYMEEMGFNAETRNSSEVTCELRTANKSSEIIVLFVPTEFPGSQTEDSSITGSSTVLSGKRTKESDIRHEMTMDTSKMEPEKQMVKETDEAGACSSENLIDQHGEIQVKEGLNMGSQVHSSAQDVMELESNHPTIVDFEPVKGDRSKRSRESEQITRDQIICNGFIRSPCEGLRPRNARVSASVAANENGKNLEATTKKPRRQSSDSDSQKEKKDNMDATIHKCGIEGCQMTFETKTELVKHRRNRCTHEGCEKCFRSHKYAVLHQRVHADERPLKCPWKGCKMSFKWAWARTEHLRLHTGERPYQCEFEGCGLTFRFVSDYSRHRRRTGHYVN